MNENSLSYAYNATGERIMKSYGTMEGVYINGAPQGITFHETDNFTLYPASIISINKNRFTKHYFIGDKRVASRIGTGMFNNVYGRNGSYVTAGQQDYAERMNQIQTQKEAYYKKVGVAPGVPTEKGAYGDPENTGVGYNAVLTELGNHDVPQGWIQTPRPNTTPGTNPGAPVSWNDPSNPDDPQAGYGYIANDTTKEETFFYHSDHLGSTSYITDDHANITQYDAYLPYGELLVDEHSSSEELPYKFNGKEMDEETGLYYYGARYMDPKISMWLGVDPMIEKYPEISPYIYCHNNPIVLIDPDGRQSKVPPTIIQIIDYGIKNSKKFSSLMKAANVNKANINSVIRFGNETSTDPITGHIQITKDKRVKFQVIKLTHELTNRANKAKLAKATNDVANKKISPEVYAKKIMEIELDGQINQIKVAADIGFQYPGEENKRINSLIQNYSKNKNINLRKILSPNTSLRKDYIKQGKAVRKQ